MNYTEKIGAGKHFHYVLCLSEAKGMDINMENYTIGAVSEKLGISRDTLRFYEKKGMLKPEKQENGYRRYTGEDVRLLLDILFFRRVGFSLDEINHILHHGSYHSVVDLIEQKMEEEKRYLLQHSRALTHLRVAEKLYMNIGEYINRYDIRKIPTFYVVDEDCLSGLKDVYDVCYIFEEYRLSAQQLRLVDKHMMISTETAGILNICDKLGDRIFHTDASCAYTILEGDSRSPEPDALLHTYRRAAEQGYELTGTIYSDYLLTCAKDGKNVHYFEVYLPLANASAS